MLIRSQSERPAKTSFEVWNQKAEAAKKECGGFELMKPDAKAQNHVALRLTQKLHTRGTGRIQCPGDTLDSITLWFLVFC